MNKIDATPWTRDQKHVKQYNIINIIKEVSKVIINE